MSPPRSIREETASHPVRGPRGRRVWTGLQRRQLRGGLGVLVRRPHLRPLQQVSAFSATGSELAAFVSFPSSWLTHSKEKEHWSLSASGFAFMVQTGERIVVRLTWCISASVLCGVAVSSAQKVTPEHRRPISWCFNKGRFHLHTR